jgi:hypothetical protein
MKYIVYGVLNFFILGFWEVELLGTRADSQPYGKYIFLILGQLASSNPDCKMTTRIVFELNKILVGVIKKVLDEAENNSKTSYVTASQVQDAVRLKISGEMSKHLVSAGVKASVM